MEIIILLIGISLTMALGFLGLFIWNIRSGQYEDTYTPSVRILFGERKNEAKEPEKDQVIKLPENKNGAAPVLISTENCPEPVAEK